MLKLPLQPLLLQTDKANRFSLGENVNALALQAILCEVSASPKPGLVDRYNSGAHKDMDFFTFLSSAIALDGYFKLFVELGQKYQHCEISELLEKLRLTGIEAEKSMFVATGGINTHKGMIFSLGVLCGAVGWLYGKKELTAANLYDTTKAMCQNLCTAEYRNLKYKSMLTKGEQIFLKYGITGIRGEAQSGFSTIKEVSYPVFKQLMKKDTFLNDVLVQTLLHLIAHTDDTNIIARHNLSVAQYAKEEAKKALTLGGITTTKGLAYIRQMDVTFIEKNISPGGCADLLAVTHFLYCLENI